MPSNSTFNEFNTFVPLSSSVTAQGRSSSPDLTLDPSMTSSQNFSTIMRNRAYARLDESSMNRANPPFDTGASGRIINSLSEQGNVRDPRISRGYIRRTSVDGADPTSGFRLYFMFNPSTIQRSYVSYLDQQALDPFNTIFGSQNLVAPPGILNFSFDLFFDRQVENANGSMPRGVLEDFDYFDLVVRGVVPDPQSPDLPDNGVMLINPRNITVVFSPQLSVSGRASGASVSYQKFDHHMRPVRMTIGLQMMVYYIGPVRQDFTFAQAKVEGTVQATVPYENSAPVQLDNQNVKFARQELSKGSISSSFISSALIPPGSSILTGNTAKYAVVQGFSPTGHHGFDFAAQTGTPIVAPVPGVVQFAGPEDSAYDGFGYAISVLTDDGLGPNGEQLLLIYGHLLPSAIAVVPGQHVGVGEYLGKTDNTGNSSVPHLHFEIRLGGIGGSAIDPGPYLISGWQILV